MHILLLRQLRHFAAGNGCQLLIQEILHIFGQKADAAVAHEEMRAARVETAEGKVIKGDAVDSPVDLGIDRFATTLDDIKAMSS